MAGVVISVSVSGGGGVGTTVGEDLEETLNDDGWELVIVRGPHACAPCRANNNPHNVPCAQCTGNRAGNADDPDDDADDQFRCQCRVKLVRKHGGDITEDDAASLENL